MEKVEESRKALKWTLGRTREGTEQRNTEKTPKSVRPS